MIVRAHIRPRGYIAEKAERSFASRLAGRTVIGVHIRGTDALVDPDRALKQERIDFTSYYATLEHLLARHPDAAIFGRLGHAALRRSDC